MTVGKLARNFLLWPLRSLATENGINAQSGYVMHLNELKVAYLRINGK